jgi:peptide/nickel transport system substrate-binding protein
MTKPRIDMSFSAITRRSAIALAASATALSLTGRARGQTAGTFTIVQPWEFRTLKLGETGHHFTRAGVVETLVQVDLQGRVVPAIAESWAVSDDARQWRFRIRRGITFQDGSPCSPAAVKASFDRLLPETLYLKRTQITAISVDGDDVVFRLKEPFGPLPAYLVDYSAAVLAPASYNAQGEVTRVIGSGPFAIRALEAPRSMELQRHDAYRGSRPALAAARYDAVTSGDTRGNIAIAGDAALVFNIPAPAVARVEAGRAMRVERPIIPRVHVLMFNCGKPQFADPRTRRALNMAIDRQAIATGIMRNPALAATQYMPPVLKDWHFPDLAPHRHDPAGANRLLDEAGWTRGADGVRARNGTRFAGSIRTFANRPELPSIAAVLQQQFRQVGFELTISVGEWQAIVEGQRDGTLDLGLSSRNTTLVPDPIATVALDFASDQISPGAVGTTNWRDDELRALVAAYLAEGDSARQPALRRRIMEIVQEQVPILPVVWYDQIVAVNPRIAGFSNDPFEQRLFLNEIIPG